MSETQQPAPVIVKKVKKAAPEGHHGGAWKVAYADFVTAMMAFFLLMWLLNATTEKQRKGIADYFDPAVPISPISAGGTGVMQGDSFLVEDDKVGDRPEGVRPETPLPRRDGVGEDPSEGDSAAPEAQARDGGPDEESAMAADAEADAALEALAEGIREALAGAGGDLGEHFILHLSPEGLVIEIVDRSDAPLFASGSAAPGARLSALMGVVAEVLGRTSNPLKLVGHTDARPFAGAGSDNWQLSAARANAARRLLTREGMAPGRIVEVAGRAATEPLMADPEAPQNRRIAITLLREAAR